jgi:GTP-binding protein LepA
MRGYPTMEDELCSFEEADLDEVGILVSNDEVDALSSVCHRSAADDRGCKVLHKMRSEIPRQPFEVALQAAVGGELIAPENTCAL